VCQRPTGSVSEPTHGWWCYWHRVVVRCLDSGTAIRFRGGKWCGSSVLSAQASRNGLPAARAGVQDVMSARRVLTRRGTAASVPAEFKTMALSFGTAVYKIPYCVQVRRLGLPCHRLWCVAGWRGRKVLADGGTFAGACSWQAGQRTSVVSRPVAPSGLVLRPRSGRCLSPSCPYGSVRRCVGPHGLARRKIVRQDGSDFWNPSQGGGRKCVATWGSNAPCEQCRSCSWVGSAPRSGVEGPSVQH